jgi:hypothetical protein
MAEGLTPLQAGPEHPLWKDFLEMQRRRQVVIQLGLKGLQSGPTCPGCGDYGMVAVPDPSGIPGTKTCPVCIGDPSWWQWWAFFIGGANACYDEGKPTL